MIKTDYQYKTQIHELARSFIRKNLPVPRNQIKVLCLPGYHAYEVENIYKKLNIPLENIIGIEKDKKIHRHLSNTQRFKVENVDLLDYVKNTSNRFHVMSLDFVGYLTDKERTILSTIGERDLLEDNCILLTTFQGRRERKEEQTKYKHRKAWFEATYLFENILSNQADLSNKDSINGFHNLNKSGIDDTIVSKLDWDAGAFAVDNEGFCFVPKKIDNARMRDVAVPLEVYFSLTDVRNAKKSQISKLFDRFLDFVPPSVLDLIITKGKIPALTTDFLNKKLNNYFKFVSFDEIKSPSFKESPEEKQKFLQRQAYGIPFNKIFDHFSYRVFGWQPYLIHLIKLHEMETFLPNNIKLYKYKSDDGTPMICDFWSLENSKKSLSFLEEYSERFFEVPPLWWFKEELESLNLNKLKPKQCRDLINFLSSGKMESNDGNIIYKLSKDYVTKFTRLSNRMLYQMQGLGEGKIERKFLGSFYKPKANKEEVAKLLLAGASDQEIRNKLRIKNMELAGIKAASKRGFYDHLKPAPKPKIVSVPKISEEEQEAIKREQQLNVYTSLLSGLPDNKLLEEYKLEKMELAGYKAAIKRRNRPELIKEAKEKAWGMNKSIIIPQIIQNCSKKGIFYFYDDYSTSRKNINHLKFLGHDVTFTDKEDESNSLIKQNNYGLYIINNAEKYFRLLENICLENCDEFLPPSILAIGNSILKDQLYDLVSVEKELGIISRLFFHRTINEFKSEGGNLEEILNKSLLVN